MKQFFFGLAACGLAAVLPAEAANVARMNVADAATSNPDRADSAPAAADKKPDREDSAPARATDPSLCLDSMETVPDDDDLVPTPTAVDGGCSVSTDTIST
jgi:hypothetical protein